MYFYRFKLKIFSIFIFFSFFFFSSCVVNFSKNVDPLIFKFKTSKGEKFDLKVDINNKNKKIFNNYNNKKTLTNNLIEKLFPLQKKNKKKLNFLKTEKQKITLIFYWLFIKVLKKIEKILHIAENNNVKKIKILKPKNILINEIISQGYMAKVKKEIEGKLKILIEIRDVK